ncbi:hypothetical protein [uncultured Thalassospira sp.]|jgi:hypothetical protein|tara:strand:+ start:91358 stop:91486 length:129 start_codon:yes stop_codon:yes gene_type:complete
MSKGQDRRKEEKKPKKKKPEVAPAPTFNKGLTITTKPKPKKP